MGNRRGVITILMLMVWTVLPAVARPSALALLRVEQGSATVDGRQVLNGAVVYEGGRLVLTDRDKVTLKLLGSSKQVQLKGPYSQSLQKAALTKDAVSLKRGELTLGLSTLKGNTIGGGLERHGVLAEQPPRPVVRPVVPLRIQGVDPEYRVVEFAPFEGSMEGYVNFIQILDLEADGSPPLFAEYQIDELQPTVFRASLLKPGRNYALRVESTDTDEGTETTDGKPLPTPVQVPFRILTSDEQQLLDSYAGKTDVQSLLERAELAEGLAQYEEVVRTLRILRASNLSRYPNLRESVKKELAFYNRLVEAR